MLTTLYITLQRITLLVRTRMYYGTVMVLNALGNQSTLWIAVLQHCRAKPGG